MFFKDLEAGKYDISNSEIDLIDECDNLINN